MTDKTDPPHAPEAKVHHEPAAAHTDDPAVTAHARDMEGVGGHGDEHMSDDHGHDDARLGPIDWAAWGYAGIGLLAGLIVVAAFWLAVA